MTYIDHKGHRYAGRSIDTIARRVWGRTAYVKVSPDPSSIYKDRRKAQILRTNKFGTHVLAEVLVPNDAVDWWKREK